MSKTAQKLVKADYPVITGIISLLFIKLDFGAVKY